MKYDFCPEENPSIYLLTKGSFAFFLGSKSLESLLLSHHRERTKADKSLGY